MFRRTDKTDAPVPELREKGPGAKGRPTPSRKEAQAASRQRARQTMDKKAARKVMRERQAERNVLVRQAMKTGDERYLPARDRGPVKRFVRDFVDARLTVVEFMFPVLVVILGLQYSGQTRLVAFSAALMPVVVLVALVDVTWMVFRVKRGLRKELPGESSKGVGFYIVSRLINPRIMRMPKPRVRVGGAPK